MGTRSSVRFEMHMTYAELSSNKYFPYCVMGLVLHLHPLVSSKMDCSRQWIYQTCLCTKATAFFQVFSNWSITEFLQELEASLEVPMGVGKKMQLVKIGSTLHFVIRSGIRNSEFHKQCYYQSVLAQKIFNNFSRTLNRTRDNTAVHALPFIPSASFWPQLRRGEYFSVKNSYQETTRF